MPVLTSDERLATAQDFAQLVQDAQTVDELRGLFLAFYLTLGWKALCRMAFKRESPEMALASRVERRALAKGTADDE